MSNVSQPNGEGPHSVSSLAHSVASSDGGSPSSLQGAAQAFAFASSETVEWDTLDGGNDEVRLDLAADDSGASAYFQQDPVDEVFRRGCMHALFPDGYDGYETTPLQRHGFERAPTYHGEGFHEVSQAHSLAPLANIYWQPPFPRGHSYGFMPTGINSQPVDVLDQVDNINLDWIDARMHPELPVYGFGHPAAGSEEAFEERLPLHSSVVLHRQAASRRLSVQPPSRRSTSWQWSWRDRTQGLENTAGRYLAEIRDALKEEAEEAEKAFGSNAQAQPAEEEEAPLYMNWCRRFGHMYAVVSNQWEVAPQSSAAAVGTSEDVPGGGSGKRARSEGGDSEHAPGKRSRSAEPERYAECDAAPRGQPFGSPRASEARSRGSKRSRDGDDEGTSRGGRMKRSKSF